MGDSSVLDSLASPKDRLPLAIHVSEIVRYVGLDHLDRGEDAACGIEQFSDLFAANVVAAAVVLAVLHVLNEPFVDGVCLAPVTYSLDDLVHALDLDMLGSLARDGEAGVTVEEIGVLLKVHVQAHYSPSSSEIKSTASSIEPAR